MRILCGKFLGGYEVEGTRGRGEGLMLECLNVGMLECWNVRMLECWNGGLDGLGGLEGLDWKQQGQLVKTTFKRCAGAGPCGCFAVRASRSPNLIAHPLATFATRKLLTTFVGGPDRYAAGASRDRRISTPAFFVVDIIA